MLTLPAHRRSGPRDGSAVLSGRHPTSPAAALGPGAFLKAVSGVGAVSIAAKLAALALGVLLARWLGPEGYGLYAFAMAMVVLLAIPCRFGLPELVMREIAVAEAGGSSARPRALFLRAAALVLALSLGVAAAGLLLISSTAGGGASLLDRPVVIGLCILPILALLELSAHAARALRRPVLAQALLELVPTLGALGLLAAALAFLDPGVEPSAALAARWAAAAVALAIGFGAVLRLMPVGEAAAGGRAALGMLRHAAPFLAIGGAGVVMARSDTLFLGALHGAHEVGLYNAALQGALLIQLVPQVANAVAAPEFARLNAAGAPGALGRLAVTNARLVAATGVAVAVVLALAGEALLGLFFGAPFRAAADALAVLAAGHALSLIVGSPGFLLSMSGHQSLTLWLVVTGAGLNLALNALLIPQFGLVGAAAATSLSLVCWKTMAYCGVRRRLGIGCAAFDSGRSLA